MLCSDCSNQLHQGEGLMAHSKAAEHGTTMVLLICTSAGFSSASAGAALQ
jgi:hypothetical protein